MVLLVQLRGAASNASAGDGVSAMAASSPYAATLTSLAGSCSSPPTWQSQHGPPADATARGSVPRMLAGSGTTTRRALG